MTTSIVDGLLGKESFRPVQLGSEEHWRAHRVVNGTLVKKIVDMIPRPALRTVPRPLAVDAVLPPGVYTCTQLPRDARRVFLVLTKIEGKKLIFMADQESTYLLSMTIDSKIAFERGAVFEGFASEDERGRVSVQLTDTLLYCGVNIDDMTHKMRKLFAHVIVATAWKPRVERDPLLLKVEMGEDIADLQAVSGCAVINHNALILYARDEARAHERVFSCNALATE